MVRVLRAGPGALLLECPDTASVQAWHASLFAEREAGQLDAVEIVPAARTVLLDGVADPTALAAKLTTRPEPAPVPSGVGPLVQIPTVYDGPDLAEVADLWGTDVAGVIAIHTSLEFRVAFCGFAPGFAYLTGLPARYHLPRRASPRPSVPPGTVALAGAFAGVYPVGSPGGWQLLGRTEVRLFDLAAEPSAPLAPGTRVRFRRCGP